MDVKPRPFSDHTVVGVDALAHRRTLREPRAPVSLSTTGSVTPGFPLTAAGIPSALQAPQAHHPQTWPASEWHRYRRTKTTRRRALAGPGARTPLLRRLARCRAPDRWGQRHSCDPSTMLR